MSFRRKILRLNIKQKNKRILRLKQSENKACTKNRAR
jgi:hypothetical protein